jgi:hypothetical protein
MTPSGALKDQKPVQSIKHVQIRVVFATKICDWVGGWEFAIK